MTEIKALASPIDDVPVPEGKVEEVCRNWSVLEDNALAHRLQEEEIENHYTGNIERRRTVRKDITTVKDISKDDTVEVLMAKEEARKQLKDIEEMDRRAAELLYQEFLQQERESYERQKSQEKVDEDMARKLQEREERKLERWRQKKREREERQERERLERLLGPQAVEDSSSLPSYTEKETDLNTSLGQMSLEGERAAHPSSHHRRSHHHSGGHHPHPHPHHPHPHPHPHHQEKHHPHQEKHHPYPEDQLPPEGYHEDFAQNYTDKPCEDNLAYLDDEEEEGHTQDSPGEGQLKDDKELAKLLQEQEFKRKSPALLQQEKEMLAHDEVIAKKFQQEEHLMADQKKYRKYQDQVSAELASPEPHVFLNGEGEGAPSRQKSVPKSIKYGQGGVVLSDYTHKEDIAGVQKSQSLPASRHTHPSSDSNRHSHGSHDSSGEMSAHPVPQTVNIAAALDPTYKPGDVEGVMLLKKAPLNKSVPPIAASEEIDDNQFFIREDPENENREPGLAPVQGTRRKIDNSKKEKKKSLFSRLSSKKKK